MAPQQGCQLDLRTEWDIDFEQRQAGGHGWYCRPLAGLQRRVPVLRRRRLDACPAPRRPFAGAGPGGHLPAEGRFATLEDAVKLLIQPCLPRHAGREVEEGVMRPSESVCFKHRTRHRGLAVLRKSQGPQQMVRVGGHEALGEALQKSLGSRAISIEKCRRRSEQQDVAIARARTHSLFGKRQRKPDSRFGSAIAARRSSSAPATRGATPGTASCSTSASLADSLRSVPRGRINCGEEEEESI